MRDVPQENHARAIRRALSDLLAPRAAVSVDGGGVHWHCAAVRGARACRVNCFENGGPEYLIEFRDETGTRAWGRTTSAEETVAAVAAWLDLATFAQFHERFPFVERRKRALEAIAEVARRHPGLGRSAAVEVCPIVCDLHELHLTASDRSCLVSFSGADEHPDASLLWDGTEQLRTRTGDPTLLAGLFARWLCDRASPSEVADEFEGVEVAPVARYYQTGRPVEGEFVVSWDEAERFYGGNDVPGSGAMLRFIAEARRAGYDRRLRAGTSLWALVVSRSRRHGLRPGQPRIAFWVEGERLTAEVQMDGPTQTQTFPRAGLSPEVERLLRSLAAREID